MYISSYDNQARFQMTECLSHLLIPKLDAQPLVFLCIGSDRSIGDCLGPLVGHFLNIRGVDGVFGSLETPIHAVNLASSIDTIYRQYANPFIVAIDACFGRHEKVGHIQIENIPLRPGEGVGKDLPEIGEVSIKGIINAPTPGLTDYNMLATTRLHTVYHMAQCISDSIIDSLK